jgi:hypothetical protein
MFFLRCASSLERSGISFPRSLFSYARPLLFFARCVHVPVRSQISFVRSRSVVVRRVTSFDRCVDFLVGHAGFVGGRAHFFVRTEHAIAGRDYFFNDSLDLFGRRVIFSGRRGESFPRRDTDFRRRADFVVAHAYFFGAGDRFFFASSHLRDSRACTAVTAQGYHASLHSKTAPSTPKTSTPINPLRTSGSS